MLKKLPAECIAPLRLKEITLHGIGSYLRPAKLEIRPLTILCGTNGSGKSTWIKALDALCTACEKESFPFDLLPASIIHGVGLLNTVVQNMSDKDWPPCDWDHEFGPLGTMGVMFECVKKINLGSREIPTIDGIDARLQTLLEAGEILRGDCVSIRITHQMAEPKRDMTRRFLGLRLCVNGKGVEYRRSLHVENTEWSLHAIELGQRAGRSFSRLIQNNSSNEKWTDSDYGDACAFAIGDRVRSLIKLWSEGFFRIKAIRQVQEQPESWYPHPTCYHNKEELSCYREAQPARSRYVGPNGEHTQHLRSSFSTAAMLDPRPQAPYLGIPDAHYSDECDPSWILRSAVGWAWVFEHAVEELNALAAVLCAKPTELPKEHMDLCSLAEAFSDHHVGARCNNLAALCRKKLSFCVDAFWPAQIKEVSQKEPEKDVIKSGRLSLVELAISSTPIPSEPFFGSSGSKQSGLRGEFGEALRLLGVRLRSEPDLFWLLLRIVREDPEHAPIKEENIPQCLRFLAGLDRSSLNKADLAFMHAWACRLGWTCDPISGSVLFDTIYGFWMRRLLGVRIVISFYEIDLAKVWHEQDRGPSGFLLPSEWDTETGGPEAAADYRSTFFPPDWQLQPQCFSSGFHQIAPVLVQFGLMRMNELCSVENPEVHLHPGLQLKFAEFFIENAKIGKFGLIETHSDLFVRRVYRAIREEDIRQGWVGVYFVHEEEVTEYRTENENAPHTSVISPWKNDEKGRISNWPEGFLQDDVDESKALLRAMYGGMVKKKKRGGVK